MPIAANAPAPTHPNVDYTFYQLAEGVAGGVAESTGGSGLSMYCGNAAGLVASNKAKRKARPLDKADLTPCCSAVSKT